MTGRWKVACINWGHSQAPHALTYFWVGGGMRGERYWSNWADAVAYVDGMTSAPEPHPGLQRPRRRRQLRECSHGDR